MNTPNPENDRNSSSVPPAFTPPPAPPVTPAGGDKKESGVGLAALICGIVCFFFNPMYAVSLAAVILGIVGIARAGKDSPKTMAIIGLCLGGASMLVSVIIDIILIPFTWGLSFCF